METEKPKVTFKNEMPAERAKYDHAAVAEELMSRPGSWAEVELPVQYASIIRRGALSAYPVGLFEVAVRGGKLNMRFAGTPEEYRAAGGGRVGPGPVAGKGSVYDHEALRAELRELGPGSGVWRADWPKSYVPLIKRGALGYKPAGAWSATYVKDFGLGVTFLGGGIGHE